jgi:hypothetical protein
MNISHYDPDLIVYSNTNSDGRGVIDLNLLSLDGYLGSQADIQYSPSSIAKRLFDSKKDKFSLELYNNAKLVSQFLLTYRSPGRRTIYNGLTFFFNFQVDSGRSLRDPSFLLDYCIFLQSKIFTREFGRVHCTALLSNINKFLIFTGDINSNFKFDFERRNRIVSKETYTDIELKKIIQVVFKLYYDCSQMLKEHIERQSMGLRQFDIFKVSSIETARFNNPDIEFDYIVNNPTYWFMQCAYIILCLFTWGNEKQLIELDIGDFDFDSKGAESTWLFKGRAASFVRLSIGVSGLEGDKTGIEFYKDFLSVRSKLITYLKEKDYYFSLGEPLLFSASIKSPQVRRLKPHFSVLNQHSLVQTAKIHNFKIPLISTTRIRRSVEQHTDNQLKNPFLTLNKSQHSWETYRKNYASGNPVEARQKISNALNYLTLSAISEQDVESRKNAANEYGITLVSNDAIEYQINGFGCLDKSNNSTNSKAFIQKQERNGRSPKVCADLSNCVNCTNCAVIDDESAIYQVLSFQYMIDFKKPVYIGSKKAYEKYDDLVKRIDLMLAFVDSKVLARARLKLQQKGVADEWKT